MWNMVLFSTKKGEKLWFFDLLGSSWYASAGSVLRIARSSPYGSSMRYKVKYYGYRPLRQIIIERHCTPCALRSPLRSLTSFVILSDHAASEWSTCSLFIEEVRNDIHGIGRLDISVSTCKLQGVELGRELEAQAGTRHAVCST